jgi:hypothetical protein
MHRCDAWRRMLKIKWTDKIRNEEVYRRIYEEKTLWDTYGKEEPDWPHPEAQWIREKCNRRKIEGNVSREWPRDKCKGQIKKKVHR